MRFVKMHGIGNDYVYVNGFEEVVADPGALSRFVANRQFGVGSDGLILILPPEKHVAADVRMRMFNADGSESEMCGNGIRCVCKMAFDHGISRANPMRVQTGRGVLTLHYTLGDDGLVNSVRVDMGEPILEAKLIPTTIAGNAQAGAVVNAAMPELGGDLNNSWMAACGLDPRITCVSMGNPHVVIFCTDVAKVPLEKVGPLLEHSPLFPKRVNVHFAQVHSPGEVTMRTWERGSGITLACGTGACAVCVAGVLAGHTDRRITAHLPGGDLELEWDAHTNYVFKTGPATEVFIGELSETLAREHGLTGVSPSRPSIEPVVAR